MIQLDIRSQSWTDKKICLQLPVLLGILLWLHPKTSDSTTLLLRDRKVMSWANWKIEWREMFTQDRNSARTDEKVMNWWINYEELQQILLYFTQVFIGN